MTRSTDLTPAQPRASTPPEYMPPGSPRARKWGMRLMGLAMILNGLVLAAALGVQGVLLTGAGMAGHVLAEQTTMHVTVLIVGGLLLALGLMVGGVLVWRRGGRPARHSDAHAASSGLRGAQQLER